MSFDNSNTTTAAMGLNTVPLSQGALEVSANRADNLVALRPACDQLGIDFSRQLRKLRSKHWAVVDMKAMTGADGKTYEMVMVTRDTFTMWLATIEPSRVNEEVRETLTVFQKEAVAALDSYFHEGVAINPRATEDQVQRLINHATGRMNLIHLARGVIQADFLEAQARIILAEGMGRKPELDPERLPLEVTRYLSEKGLSENDILALRVSFGTRLSNLYLAERGERPSKTPKTVNGGIHDVNVYTEEHRHLFDHVFLKMGLDQSELAGI